MVAAGNSSTQEASPTQRVEEFIMVVVNDGQCGLCTHFGEHATTEGRTPRLVEILTTHQAAEDLVTACGHPKLEGLHLRVTPVSGCDGFQSAAA